MAAVRHLETIPDHHGPRAEPRHLRLVAPAHGVHRPSAGVYRRRRLVVGTAVALIVVVGARTLSPDAGASPPAPSTPPVVHVVQPGDSYWSIAASLDRPGDIRATVDALSSSNGDRVLQVGDRLAVPG